MKYISIYLSDDDEEVLKQVKQLCKQLNISLSALVRGFFRALQQGQRNIYINQQQAIQIGAVQIAVVQQQQTINNINIKLELEEALRYIEAGLQSQNYTKMYSALKLSREKLKKIVSNL